ncbi:MAG: metallophosphatase family protein [Chloroflexota bacterium]|nr:metallophosphatase family protein [Chloroflexota bacterium]
MRIAILADIHGNLPALEAALTDVQAQAPDAVYLAGDQINRCPWNNQVLDLLDSLGWPAIYGNHELVIGRLNTNVNPPPFTDRTRFIDLWWTQEQLYAHHLAAIRSLPAERTLHFAGTAPIRLLHGIPGNPFIGLLAEMSDQTIGDLLAPVCEPVIVCAHTHRPLVRKVDRWQVFNGGSVGASYNGDPRAHYLLLDALNGNWQPTFRRVDYDHSVIPVAFRTSGLLDALGRLGDLHLRTVLDGNPWSSDFGYWMRTQPPTLHDDLDSAVAAYLQQHGPGHWAFDMAE